MDRKETPLRDVIADIMSEQIILEYLLRGYIKVDRLMTVGYMAPPSTDVEYTVYKAHAEGRISWYEISQAIKEYEERTKTV